MAVFQKLVRGLSVGGGKSMEAMIDAVATDILARLSPQFDVEAVSTAYPTSYDNSMNTVSLKR